MECPTKRKRTERPSVISCSTHKKNDSKKYSLKSIVFIKISHTFAVHKEPRSHIAGRRVKRESGANPEQYLLLCISTPLAEFMFVTIFATGESWEGVTSGMSQKTYLVHFKDEYLQDTGKNQNCLFYHLYLIFLREHSV